MSNNFHIGNMVINFSYLATVKHIYKNGDLLLEGYGVNAAGLFWRADPKLCKSAY